MYTYGLASTCVLVPVCICRDKDNCSQFQIYSTRCVFFLQDGEIATQVSIPVTLSFPSYCHCRHSPCHHINTMLSLLNHLPSSHFNHYVMLWVSDRQQCLMKAIIWIQSCLSKKNPCGNSLTLSSVSLSCQVTNSRCDWSLLSLFYTSSLNTSVALSVWTIESPIFNKTLTQSFKAVSSHSTINIRVFVFSLE